MSLTPRILERPQSVPVRDAALALGYTPTQAAILAGRLGDAQADELATLVRPSLALLTPPSRLPDITPAVDAIVDAIVQGRTLILNGDYDCDGNGSISVMWLALRDYLSVPEAQIRRVVAHRRRDGYGLSQNIADQMLDDLLPRSCVITADQGSADEQRIAQLVAASHVVVVTDHHGIPEAGIPRSAHACVNPVRADSQYGDPYIAGCAVAWLVMCAVRQRLIDIGHIPATTPKLTQLLQIVAVSTVADAVTLGLSRNNRAIVSAGLAMINSEHAMPCWRAYKIFTATDRPLTSQDLAFGVCPRVNSVGRMDQANASIDWLMARSEEEALDSLQILDQHNTDRKATEQAMREALMPQALDIARRGSASVVVLQHGGHQGVMGVVASRLLEATGRPCAVFVSKLDNAQVLTGSFRSIPGVHIRQAIARVAELQPQIFAGHGFGGHAGAAGAHFAIEHYPDFLVAFEQAVCEQVDPRTLSPTVWVDPLPARRMDLELLAELSVLGPYGRGFESAVFALQARVGRVVAMGKDGTHLRLELVTAQGTYEAVWFSAARPGEPLPVEVGQHAQFAVEPNANTFRGNTKLQLLVRQVLT